MKTKRKSLLIAAAAITILALMGAGYYFLGNGFIAFGIGFCSTILLLWMIRYVKNLFRFEIDLNIDLDLDDICGLLEQHPDIREYENRKFGIMSQTAN